MFVIKSTVVQALPTSKGFDAIDSTLDVQVQSPIRAYKATAKRGADYAAQDNAIREYVALQHAVDSTTVDLDQRAHKALSLITDKTTLETLRLAFVTVYNADYKARFPDKDNAACVAAANMAWNRFCARAVKLGWTNPKTATKAKSTKKRGKGAVAAAQKTAANATAVANAATDTPANAATDTPATVVDVAIASAIVADGDADSDLIVALRWVRESDANTQAFVAWFKEQKAAALMGSVSPSIVVPVTTRKRGAKAA